MNRNIIRIILLQLVILTAFILWNMYPNKIFNSVDLESFKPSLFKIKVCNQTNSDFKNTSINNSSYGSIEQWKCSQFKKAWELKKALSIIIITDEEWILSRYIAVPIDLVWVESLLPWEYIINVDDLLKKNKWIIEYQRWAKYSIEKL